MDNEQTPLQTTPQLRLQVLHRTITHKQNGYQTAKEMGIKYNTIRHITLTYLRTGRTNKIKNKRAKKINKILGKRAQKE